jgi:hypothetical protein
MLRWCALLLLGLAHCGAALAPAWAEDGCACDATAAAVPQFYGPLPSASQDPLALLVLQPPPAQAAVLPDGVARFSLGLAATSDRRLEDTQGVREHYHYGLTTLQLGYRARLGRGELGVELPLYYRGLGYLEPFIDGYHDVFGFKTRQTPDFPRSGYAFDIAAPGGTVYAGDSRGAGLGELALSYQQELARSAEGRRVLGARVAVKAPTGSPARATGSGSWDAGLGLLYQQRLSRRLQVYANYDFILTGAPAWPLAPRQNVQQYLAAAEYKLNRNLSATAQFQQATNPLTLGNSQSDQDAGELAAGLQGRLAGGRTWSVWLREDIHGNTGPDATFAAAVGWEF